jgi:hypothetical protein
VIATLFSTIAFQVTNVKMADTEMSERIEKLVRKSETLIVEMEESRTDVMMAVLAVRRLQKESFRCQLHVEHILSEIHQ